MTQQQLKQMKKTHKEVIIDHFMTEEEDAPQQIHLNEPEDLFKTEIFKCQSWYCKFITRVKIAIIMTLRNV
jgi:sialic acid synthase SpsE